MSSQQITGDQYSADTAFGKTYGAYYKKYDWLGKIRAGFWARNVDSASRLLRENKKDVEIIGVKSASVKYKAFDATFVNQADLTTAIDATSKAGKVKISVTNDSGDTRYLADLAVRGQLVKRISGKQGFTHDSFKDMRSIRLNGRIPLEAGNNFIQSRDHVRKIADWLWKLNGTEKSIYTYDIEGCRQYYQPGKWYSLSWTAGIELLSVVCKCLSVQSDISSAYGNTTIVEWGEVQQNWTFDSSYLTRFVVGGAFPQDNTVAAVVVAATDYTGDDANYICDGTNDEAEINLAIQWVKGTYGGGYVLLTEGTFAIGAAIEMLSGVTLLGRGEGTVLDRNCNDYTIEAVGGSGTEKTNFGIQNLKLTFTDANEKSGVYGYYADDCILRDLYIVNPPINGISCQYCDGVDISNNIINGMQVEITANAIIGIVINDCTKMNICENRISGLYTTTPYIYGIYIQPTCSEIFIMGNIINDFRMSGDSSFLYGITNTAYNVQIVSNTVADLIAWGGTGGRALGISAGTSKYLSLKDNHIRNVTGKGIYLASGGADAHLVGNQAVDNGQLLDHANCEEADAPHITGDGALSANCSYARSSDYAHTGTYSGKVTKDNAAGTFAAQRFVDSSATNDLHTLSPGKTYILTGWLYVPSVGGPQVTEIGLRLGDYQGSWGDTITYASTQDAWEFVTVERTWRGSAVSSHVDLYFGSTAAINEYVYIDDVRLYEKGVANTHSMNFSDSGTNTNTSGNSWE